MARSDRSAPRRRRLGAATEGIALLAISAAIAVPAAVFGIASFQGRTVSEPDHIVVCDSGIVRQGDVSTSSAVAVRVPDGATVTVPSGCREG